ncbi:hypothetical protein [Streptomyces daliensis]|uniref:Uncharacterized protein n=1 Tax=Streptomyces daliensis TaxID=299421 RepID=A0A8T4IZS5_9ACTN|nr:hypothetical protein [Streptomyces daliensis]
MSDPAHPFLHRVLHRLLSRFVPVPGCCCTCCTCRNEAEPVPEPAPGPRTTSGRRLVVRPLDPPRMPLRRTPEPEEWVDGSRTPLVRPYLRAHEREARRAERRSALGLALDGLAPDGAEAGPWILHGHPVGTAQGAVA